MRIIKIKDQWNAKDSKLVINDRITELGLSNYWCAVDASVEFNITQRGAYVTKNQAHPITYTNQSDVDGQKRVFTSKQLRFLQRRYTP